MRRYIKDHIKRCIPCLSHRKNSGKQPGMLQEIPTPEKPFEWIHLDHTGPYPTTFNKNTHCLVMVDRLTKFAYLEPVKNTSAKETMRAVQRFMDDWGVPAKMTTDRGTCFTSAVFKDFLRRLGVRQHWTCPRRAQGNAQVERVNGVLTPLLAKLLHDQTTGRWDTLIKKVQLLLNTSINTSTGETPIRLLCGFNPVVPDRHLQSIAHPSTEGRTSPKSLRTAALDRIKSAFEETKKHYDKRHVAAEKLRTGDIVWFSAPPRAADGASRKLDPLFRGPLCVSKVLTHDTYVVVSLDDENPHSSTAHIGQLRRFGPPRGGESSSDDADPSTAVNGSADPVIQSDVDDDRASGDGGGSLTDVRSIAGESSSDRSSSYYDARSSLEREPSSESSGDIAFRTACESFHKSSPQHSDVTASEPIAESQFRPHTISTLQTISEPTPEVVEDTIPSPAMIRELTSTAEGADSITEAPAAGPSEQLTVRRRRITTVTAQPTRRSTRVPKPRVPYDASFK